MALSALDDKDQVPVGKTLRAVMGAGAGHWEALVDLLAAAYPPLTQTWNFGGEKYGWSLRLIQKKRTIIYLIPQKGHFLAGIVLGERAAHAALASRLPAGIIEAIASAPRYAEGRGIRLPVRTKTDVRSIVSLVSMKMAP